MSLVRSPEALNKFGKYRLPVAFIVYERLSADGAYKLEEFLDIMKAL